MNAQVFSTSPQSSTTSGHVYTTEIYPPSFLPSSSDSSPMESPILLPRRVPSFNNVNDHFALDGSGNNNNGQQQRDFVFTLPSPVVNNNQRAVKRKGSRASIRSNRNSMFLDPIVEESNDFGLLNMNGGSDTIVKH
ncbi:964_t:CDS:1 [Funneliformis mosseae]|uniref:964_t:CDS:1 n=1 Tax=Funneliformis mosseae TaxID=27381 RepID=A0A9N9DM76_FUNMO|nr:964_t:CDS:1 [Funneliformis mosseae]